MEDKKLTVKQQKFVDAYVTNGHNGTQAAKVAGYSFDTAKEMAYENLSKPHIKAQVGIRMKEAAIKLGISPEYRLQELKTILDGCMTGQASDHPINASGAINAIKTMNEMIGDCEQKEDNSDSQELIRDEVRKQIEESKKEY